MAKYGQKAQKTVKETMSKLKRGKLESVRSGRKVRSRKQAIAVGLAEARAKGAKVPAKVAGNKNRTGPYPRSGRIGR